MRALIWTFIAALAASMVVIGSPAFGRGLGGGFGGGGPAAWNGSHGSWVPPGWSKGNKTGWGGHKMPPGLYRKLNAPTGQTTTSHASQMHSEMDNDHRD